MKRSLQMGFMRLTVLAIVLCPLILAGEGRGQADPAGSTSSAAPVAASASTPTLRDGATNPFYADAGAARRPLEVGAIVQGGNGLTQDRESFHFMMAGVHAGKVLTPNMGRGRLHGNFEYAAELFPFWQSYTPTFERPHCTSPALGSIACGAYYNTGGTYTGVSVTPIILRWNFSGSKHVAYWAQGAGGLLWTNHKYPAFGSPAVSIAADGPNTDASVWNFTPQGGVGLHYFLKPRRSIDLGVNAVHISSASLGDKNPGVNASVLVSLGYSWWK